SSSSPLPRRVTPRCVAKRLNRNPLASAFRRSSTPCRSAIDRRAPRYSCFTVRGEGFVLLRPIGVCQEKPEECARVLKTAPHRGERLILGAVPPERFPLTFRNRSRILTRV